MTRALLSLLALLEKNLSQAHLPVQMRFWLLLIATYTKVAHSFAF